MVQPVANNCCESLQDDDMAVSEARAHMGVLRTIFAGGLMTPDRAYRHRNKGGEQMCRCGLERESVEHVSWRCMQCNDLRTDPAVTPEGCALSNDEIFYIQSFLVQVWQHRIKQWHSGGDLTIIPKTVDSQQVLRGEEIEENGHLLAARQKCQECGAADAASTPLC